MVLFFLFFLLGCNEASISMVIHKGVVMNCSSSIITKQAKWEDCIVLCAKNETCVSAQTLSGKQGTCYTCAIQDLQLLRYSWNYQDQIALKTSSSPQKECSNFQKGKYTAKFNNTSNLTQYSYTTQRSKDGLSWTYTYNITRSCPIGWERFKRKLGDWCIKFNAARYIPNQVNATKQCASAGAVLSGLESQAETDYVYRAANSALTTNLVTVWVDGVRRKGCQRIGVKLFPPGCGGLAGFNFTDKLLSAKAGYKWEPNNPDGLQFLSQDIYQDCLVLWIRPNNKLLDDTLCDPALTGDSATQGYVCGKEPGH